MKKIQLLTFIIALTAAVGALAQVPSIINYQGRLSAGGTNLFNGPGQFKFALVNNGDTNLSRQATAAATVSGVSGGSVRPASSSGTNGSSRTTATALAPRIARKAN